MAERPESEMARMRGADADDDVALLAPRTTEGLRERWLDVQERFVDDPRRAVEDADGLVDDTIEAIADVFRSQRDDLERSWREDGDPSTEDLRQALRRYRTFFDQLLRDPLERG